MVDEERIGEIVAPALAVAGVELFDVTFGGGVLRVAVDRPGGVDTGALSRLTRTVSLLLDEADPIAGSYTLEVTSPGLERKLRRPRHFAAAVDATVSVTARIDGPAVRVRGRLLTADDEGIEVDTDDGTTRIAYDDITRASTVFDWGPAPKPGTTRKKARR